MKKEKKTLFIPHKIIRTLKSFLSFGVKLNTCVFSTIKCALHITLHSGMKPSYKEYVDLQYKYVEMLKSRHCTLSKNLC